MKSIVNNYLGNTEQIHFLFRVSQMKTRISPKHAKPSVFWSRTFSRPLKPAKPAVFGIFESIKHNSEASKPSIFRIGTNQIHPKLLTFFITFHFIFPFFSWTCALKERELLDIEKWLQTNERLYFLKAGGWGQ